MPTEVLSQGGIKNHDRTKEITPKMFFFYNRNV